LKQTITELSKLFQQCAITLTLPAETSAKTKRVKKTQSYPTLRTGVQNDSLHWTQIASTRLRSCVL